MPGHRRGQAHSPLAADNFTFLHVRPLWPKHAIGKLPPSQSSKRTTDMTDSNTPDTRRVWRQSAIALVLVGGGFALGAASLAAAHGDMGGGIGGGMGGWHHHHHGPTCRHDPARRAQGAGRRRRHDRSGGQGPRHHRQRLHPARRQGRRQGFDEEAGPRPDEGADARPRRLRQAAHRQGRRDGRQVEDDRERPCSTPPASSRPTSAPSWCRTSRSGWITTGGVAGIIAKGWTTITAAWIMAAWITAATTVVTTGPMVPTTVDDT